jgi:hypothetical protein
MRREVKQVSLLARNRASASGRERPVLALTDQEALKQSGYCTCHGKNLSTGKLSQPAAFSTRKCCAAYTTNTLVHPQLVNGMSLSTCEGDIENGESAMSTVFETPDASEG